MDGKWQIVVDATNADTVLHRTIWTNVTTRQVYFYHAGNADFDTDGDALADARERFVCLTATNNCRHG